MKLFAAIAISIAIVALSACASMGPTPEQMKAMEGLSSSLCIKSPGWNGSSVDVHYSSFGGRSTGTAGGGGKAACGSSTVEFNNEGRLPQQPHAVPPVASPPVTPK